MRVTTIVALLVTLCAGSAMAQLGHEVPRDSGGGGSGCGPVNPDVPCYGGGGWSGGDCVGCENDDGYSDCVPEGPPNWTNCPDGTSYCVGMPGEVPQCEPVCGDRCLST